MNKTQNNNFKQYGIRTPKKIKFHLLKYVPRNARTFYEYQNKGMKGPAEWVCGWDR
jgi:hypothetical protein